ncbi:MAG: DNA-directed RNA polymerase subunit H [Candidatus Micrarchaeota archaeon]
MIELESAFTSHYLVPKAEKISAEDLEKVLSELKITVKNLPLIKESDPMCVALELKAGDVVKITRPSATVKETPYYRFVVE